MKIISKILATILIFFYSTISFANISESPKPASKKISNKIEALEARIAKMEQEAINNKKTIPKIEDNYSGYNKQIIDFFKKNQLFGRLQFDKTFITNNKSSSNPLYDNSNLRAGRIGIKGNLEHNWSYKYEMDFANNYSKVTDAYIQKYFFNNKSLIKIGQFKEPFSLEELTSSRFTTFLERASINGVSPKRNLGIQYSNHSSNTNFFVGGFGDNAGSGSVDGDESKSITTRFTFFDQPNFSQQSKNDIIHLGVAYRISKPTTNTVSYNFKPEASIKNSPFVIEASDVYKIDRVNQVGLELATVFGPYSIQSEYIRNNISGDKSHFVDGYYVQLSAFLTNGDKRNYNTKKSTFERIKPVSKDGAWEVAYRFSKTNANHNDFDKGAINNNTIGLNYYTNNNISFLLNYVNVNADKNTVYGANAQIVALRAQVYF
jgi:phosphate-selective porin OprO/OprP